MESDGIDRVDVVFAVDLEAVAFEGKFVLLAFGAGVEPLDGDPAFDGSEHITPPIWHRTDAARLKLETRLAALVHRLLYGW